MGKTAGWKKKTSCSARIQRQATQEKKTRCSDRIQRQPTREKIVPSVIFMRMAATPPLPPPPNTLRLVLQWSTTATLTVNGFLPSSRGSTKRLEHISLTSSQLQCHQRFESHQR